MPSSWPLAFVERWGLGDAAIESMAGTIEDNGGVVVEVTGVPHGFDGLSGVAAGCHPVVVVNREALADRRRYTLAHELGHVVMTCDEVPTAAQEPLAHRFAAAFLVPSRIAVRELGERRRHLDLQELKLLANYIGSLPGETHTVAQSKFR